MKIGDEYKTETICKLFCLEAEVSLVTLHKFQQPLRPIHKEGKRKLVNFQHKLVRIYSKYVSPLGLVGLKGVISVCSAVVPPSPPPLIKKIL